MRLFFALWPPPATAQALAAWGRALQRDAGGRAGAAGSVHLTLAFLGEADAAKAAAAARRVRARAFDLEIQLGQYWRHNRIVWVGPRALPEALRELVAQLHGALKEDGFVLEARPFAAHVTVLRKAAGPRSLPALPPLDWPATEFALVRSVRTGKGATYETVERFALAAA